jgi:hypothetical protein
MKELENHKSDKPEMHNIKPVVKEKKFITSLRPKPGQTVYQLDLTTMVITEAVFENEAVVVTRLGGQKKKDVSIQDHCIYCAALNFKNADKRFHKMLGKKFNK